MILYYHNNKTDKVLCEITLIHLILNIFLSNKCCLRASYTIAHRKCSSSTQTLSKFISISLFWVLLLIISLFSLLVVSRAMCHFCHIHPTITLSLMILANRQCKILSIPAENNKLNASFDVYIYSILILNHCKY